MISKKHTKPISVIFLLSLVGGGGVEMRSKRVHVTMLRASVKCIRISFVLRGLLGLASHYDHASSINTVGRNSYDNEMLTSISYWNVIELYVLNIRRVEMNSWNYTVRAAVSTAWAGAPYGSNVDLPYVFCRSVRNTATLFVLLWKRSQHSAIFSSKEMLN